MQFEIGMTVERTAPWGDVVIRDITSQEEVENYKQMETQGFKFEVLRVVQ
jgi:hypothetical protein